MKVDEFLASLEARLAERSMQVGELQESLRKSEALLAESSKEIESLKSSLQSAQGWQEQSLKALEEMQSSYDKLEQLYGKLLEMWQAYQTEMQTQKASLELERNKAQSEAGLLPWIAFGTFLLGGVVGFIFEYLLGK
jgi:chromosome segregation ATPase